VQTKRTVIILVVINRTAGDFNGLANAIVNGTVISSLAADNERALIALLGIKIIINSLVGQELSISGDGQALVGQEGIEFVNGVGRRIRHQTINKIDQALNVLCSL